MHPRFLIEQVVALEEHLQIHRLRLDAVGESCVDQRVAVGRQFVGSDTVLFEGMIDVESGTKGAALVVETDAQTERRNTRQRLARIAVHRPDVVAAQVEIEISHPFVYPEFAFRFETAKLGLDGAIKPFRQNFVACSGYAAANIRGVEFAICSSRIAAIHHRDVILKPIVEATYACRMLTRTPAQLHIEAVRLLLIQGRIADLILSGGGMGAVGEKLGVGRCPLGMRQIGGQIQVLCQAIEDA